MKDHDWTRDHLAAYAVEGLTLDERERAQQHLASCTDCSAAARELEKLDRVMKEQLANARPAPGFEDRLIQSLRLAKRPRLVIPFRYLQMASGLAAVVLLGLLGYLIDQPAKMNSRGGSYSGFDTSVSQPELAIASRFETVNTRGWNDPGDSPDDYGLRSSLGVDIQAVDEIARQKSTEMEQKVKVENLQTVELKDHSIAGDPYHLGRAGEMVGGIALSFGEPMDKQGDAEHQEKNLYSYYRNERHAQDEDRKDPFFKPMAGFLGGKRTQLEELGKVEAGGTEVAVRGRPAQPPVPAAAPSNDPKSKPQDQPPIASRKVIRNGDIEFEVESFDSAFLQVSTIVQEEGGFIATTNSEKLPNGKVRGTVVIRVAPERLDTLVLKLRALGELKSQKISAEDITKHYTDLESQLRAARAMEERLLAIIKSGKGEIKELLKVEEQLGQWREKIEKVEGEIRYYNNLIALSTLSITLLEKDIRQPSGAVETEKVQMGVEVEDVEKAYKDALAAIVEAKGRILRSELKQHDAGQFSAQIACEVEADAAGPLRDRMKQLGRVARLEIGRVQTPQDGSGKLDATRVKREDTQISLSLYNLANIAPRETVHLNITSIDVEEVYKKILARVEKAGGRVVTSQLNRQKSDQITGSIQFEIPAAQAEIVLEDVRGMGEVMKLTRTENPDTQNVTKAKQGFNLQIFALGLVVPRETATLQMATKDVPAAYRTLQERIKELEGRILAAHLNENNKNNVTGSLDLEVRRDQESSLMITLSALGDVVSRTVARAAEGDNIVDSKIRYQLTLLDLSKIPPRESVTLALEVGDVEKMFSELIPLIHEIQGRVTESRQTKERSGRILAKLVFDIPLAAASGLVDRIKSAGTVRVAEASKNPSVPESDLATARIDLTLSNAELIVPSDEGFSAQFRKGLAKCFTVLTWSLNLILIGLCVVLPWGLVAMGAFKIVRRLRRPTPSAG